MWHVMWTGLNVISEPSKDGYDLFAYLLNTTRIFSHSSNEGLIYLSPWATSATVIATNKIVTNHICNPKH